MGLDEYELAASGLVRWPSELSGELYTGAANFVELARKVTTDFRARAEELQKSGDLTPSGIAKQQDLFAGQELDRLDSAAATVLGRLRRDEEELSAKLASVNTPPADSAGQAIALAECRSLLMDLPEAERIAVVSEAVASGDNLILRSIFMAPNFWRQRFVQPVELLERMRTQWQEGADPGLARKIRSLAQAITLVTNALQAARQIIASTPGLSATARTSLLQKIQADPLNSK
jgi:hypothetical protein